MAPLAGKIDIHIIEARNLPNKGLVRTSDPYVVVWAGDQRLAYTEIVYNNVTNPRWDTRFDNVDISADHIENIEVEVCDQIVCMKDMDMGKLLIPAEDLARGEEIGGWFKVNKTGGEINLTMKYTPVEALPSNQEISNSYFPVHHGCRVTLYQDAHQHADGLPTIRFSSGDVYRQKSCWDDCYASLKEATRFIYITGWSVWPSLTMVRNGESHSETLGELLKRKADQGVDVKIMVWDEQTSNMFNRSGLMMTHDEECDTYFANSKVSFAKVARGRDSTNALLSAVGVLFTHHQKTVICDAESRDPSRRRVISYVGGLDLTDGRYDDASHPLFRTLKTVHKEDFHQACVQVVKGEEITAPFGPREPWHDIHGKFEGTIARDVFTNFIERWRKQVHRQAKTLINLDGDHSFLSAEEERVYELGNKETWSCQLFRSIDARSAEFSRSTANLFSKKGRFVDAGIHKAYIHHIRRAKRFIYIENQYFLGSSHLWNHPMKGADHLIPATLVNKILSKIKKRQRFTVYIVVPLYPEGDPYSTSVQQILHWQWQTIAMMYRKIAEGLAQAGLNHHPTEYLMVFALGNRETTEGNQADPNPPQGLPSRLAQTRRFMIYVHSKMMIVDDDFIILGSANINQRSMIATRDTEIAVGAWQPHYDGERGEVTDSQIHGFRMSLWAEHLGRVEEAFRRPNSPECVQSVQQLAQENWNLYRSNEVREMTGHLMTYPYDVSQAGIVNSLPGCVSFPDTSAAIVPPKPGSVMRQLARLTM